MEMLELTAVALAQDTAIECPFDHEAQEPPNVENDLIGVGETLGERMAHGQSTRRGQGGATETPAPAVTAGKPVRLPDHQPEAFPLTCAAHHLIPAQASLRDSDLVRWLVHGAVKPQVKDATSSRTGKLRHNVGYDVNGAENGIWAPGPYALNTDAVRIEMGLPTEPPAPGTKRRGPVEVLSSMAAGAAYEPPDPPAGDLEEEDRPGGAPSATAPSGAYTAPGRVGSAHTGTALTRRPVERQAPFPARYSYYFLYTVSAMRKVNAQYHDAHGAYSKRVREALDRMNVLVEEFAIGGFCPECKEKNEKRTAEATDFPPPRGLIAALDRLAAKLRGLIAFPPSAWRWPLYTSKMAFHYWTYKKDDLFRSL